MKNTDYDLRQLDSIVSDASTLSSILSLMSEMDLQITSVSEE